MLSINNVIFILKSIFISIVLGGIYGIIHDQITYTISQEYFTKFKYEQFGFEPQWFGGHRRTVGVIGFLATWWVGFILGFFLSIICLTLIKDLQKRSRIFLQICTHNLHDYDIIWNPGIYSWKVLVDQNRSRLVVARKPSGHK